MNETKILMPEKEVRVSGSDAPLTVGALSWKDGLTFVAKISQMILQQASFIAGVGEKGLASLTAEKIAEVVAGSAELCEWLLTRTVFVNSPTLQHSNSPNTPTLRPFRDARRGCAAAARRRAGGEPLRGGARPGKIRGRPARRPDAEASGIGDIYSYLIRHGHSRRELDRATLAQLDLWVTKANKWLKMLARARALRP